MIFLLLTNSHSYWKIQRIGFPKAVPNISGKSQNVGKNVIGKIYLRQFLKTSKPFTVKDFSQYLECPIFSGTAVEYQPMNKIEKT
jgi:hypothetical protein